LKLETSEQPTVEIW